MSDQFTVDGPIAADSMFLADWSLCHVRLMDDRRYPWLLLLPRRPGLVEWTELDADALALLAVEIKRAAEALRHVMPFDKLNVGALGNIVRQMHVHVIGRRIGDPAWPGAVWGQGQREPYDAAMRSNLAENLATAFQA